MKDGELYPKTKSDHSAKTTRRDQPEGGFRVPQFGDRVREGTCAGPRLLAEDAYQPDLLRLLWDHTQGTHPEIVPPSAFTESGGVVTARCEMKDEGRSLQVAYVTDEWLRAADLGGGVKATLWWMSDGVSLQPEQLVGRRGRLQSVAEAGYGVELDELEPTPVGLLEGPVALWLTRDVFPNEIPLVVTFIGAVYEDGLLFVSVSLTSPSCRLVGRFIQYVCGLVMSQQAALTDGNLADMPAVHRATTEGGESCG